MADLLGTGTVKKTVYNRTEEIHFVFFYSFYLFHMLFFFQKADLLFQGPTLYFVKKAKQSTSDFFDSRKMTFSQEKVAFPPKRCERLT
jgi:hypothetical protein